MEDIHSYICLTPQNKMATLVCAMIAFINLINGEAYNTICCSSYIREIGLLLPYEPILHNQIMFTTSYLYNLLIFNYKKKNKKTMNYIQFRCDTVSKSPRCDAVSKSLTLWRPFPNNDIKISDIVHYECLFTMWPLSLQNSLLWRYIGKTLHPDGFVKQLEPSPQSVSVMSFDPSSLLHDCSKKSGLLKTSSLMTVVLNL